MSLKIATREVGDVTILDISGNLTIEVSAQLRGTVHEALESGKKKLLLNLKEVSRLDSSGLGELISSFTTTSNQGGKLKLFNVPPKIQDLLMITKLITVFETFDNEQEAVASCA